ncbi:Cobalamin biosynthesis protein CobT (nicotinate-mononucleotide:5, 6-dimethylbenzimidazole phosphoribosyltransferase) [Alteromonadaceae bacterium Bs31]|nr:Cobalamin biosynthesis protein CobT (nicotinate-mononucleotide:5, 6-dimethylbenzimidazole phosphoribosyltransferase) [Alteromonadaceae bacterium Bs31]
MIIIDSRLLLNVVVATFSLFFSFSVFSAEHIDFSPPFDIGSGTVKGVSATDAADLNGDGLADIVVVEGGYHANDRVTFAWFESPDSEGKDWIRHDLTMPDVWRRFTGAVRIADIDDDGDNDIVVAMDHHSQLDPSAYIYWLENPGHNRSTSANWSIHTIIGDLSVEHINDLHIADMDNDGLNDVVVRSLTPNRMMLFFNRISSWQMNQIDTRSFAETGEGFALGDLDRDGRMDISVNGYWFKAPTNPADGIYKQYAIDTGYAEKNANTKEAVGYINDDPYLDVVISPAEGYRKGANHYLAWYEGVADPTKASSWKRHIIASNVNGRHGLALADMDYDGDLDIVSATSWNMWGQSKGITIYYNGGGQGDFSDEQLVSSKNGLYTATVVDLFADGDLDIVGPDFYAFSSKPYIYLSQLSGAQPLDKVSKPKISPGGVVFGGSLEVSISSETQDSSIYYTLDGSVPTESANYYYGSVVINDSHTVKAIAVKSGAVDSDIVQESFIKDSKAPQLLSVVPNSAGDRLTLTFDEALAASAEAKGNFRISDDVTVNSVLLSGTTVVLGTSSMSGAQQDYTLTTSNIEDLYGNVIPYEIDSQFSYSSQAVPSNLLAYWPLDEAGADVADVLGSYGGVLNGGARGDGLFGGALDFSGNDGFVDLTPVVLEGEQLTISMWFKAADFDDAEARLISQAQGDSANDHCYMLSTYNNGGLKLRFRLKADGNTATLLASSGELVSGAWTHVAAVYDGNNMVLYKDGEQVGKMPKTGQIDPCYTEPLNIGRNPTAKRYFSGFIDEVRIYKDALDLSQILKLADPTALPVSDEVDPDTGTDSGSETDPDTGTDSGSETDPDTGTDSGSETDPDTGTDSGSETDPTTGTDSGSETDPDTGTDSGSETDPDTGTDSGSETDPDTGTDSGSETDPDTGTDSGSETDPDTGTDSGSETDPDTGTDSGSETDPGTGTDSGSETDPDTGAGDDQEPEPKVDINNGLLAYWPVDEIVSNVVFDQSGNNQDGELVNGTSGSGISEGALDFAARQGYASFSPLVLEGSSFSVSLWLNAADFTEKEGRLISQAMGVSSDDHDFMLSTYSNRGMKLRARLKTNGETATLVASESLLSIGQWTHVVAVYDGSSLRLYQDGKVVGAMAITGDISSSSGALLNIGRNPVGGRYFSGSIDEIRIYSRALSDEQIQCLHNMACSAHSN